ncbi:hypothetical protein CFC21_111345 [Triticum aestivum]|uniref:Expansin n=2 Tax=Triticum aestivum TaxID=4565 RepID=A0A9R1MQD8_WHEAT|nr:expansin-A24-like [Triticum aestivum]KAF7111321.1 hypothetical protein CFC21_111345 [Triticum aestivum]
MARAAPARGAALVLLTVGCAFAVAAAPAVTWQRAHATFYGGADASGTMGGACGYGNLYSTGYGTHAAALSTLMFNDGAACGQCYKVACDRELADTRWCKPGVTVTITATNLCPPNHALPSDNGGWCNAPRLHFDMAQPAWEKIGVYKGGIIPVMYQRVPCEKRGGVRFKIDGHDYFNLVLVFNVATSGSIKSMDVKISDSNDWAPMARNWGANWQSLANLTGKMLSFRLTDTEGQTLVFHNIVSSGWKFGQTFTSSLQFN